METKLTLVNHNQFGDPLPIIIIYTILLTLYMIDVYGKGYLTGCGLHVSTLVSFPFVCFQLKTFLFL